MRSLLEGVGSGAVVPEPFPHVVVEGALEPELYERLAAALPSPQKVVGDRSVGDNQRVNYFARDVLADPGIEPLWRRFVELHTSTAFFHQVVDLFAPYLPENAREADLKALRVGVRKRDSYDDHDVLLDAMIGINTPTAGRASSVRRAHVDRGNKLYTALFYMRRPEDDSTGGDLELYRFRSGEPGGFRDHEIDDEHVTVVRTVPYRSNVMVLFLNSIRALHGVTVRSPTPVPRYFACLIGQLAYDLFDPRAYQLAGAA